MKSCCEGVAKACSKGVRTLCCCFEEATCTGCCCTTKIICLLINCIVGSVPCGLCCGGCGGKAKSSILTRFLYLSFHVVIVIISAILLDPGVQRSLQEDAIVLCVNYNRSVHVPSNVVTFSTTVNTSVDSLLNCDQFIGYLAVYRVCMGVALFFFGMLVLTLCVFKRDPRVYIQNGLWTIKWIVVIVIVIALFFIPDGQKFALSKTAMVFGLMGSFFFIIIQVVLLVDLAHRTAECLLDKIEITENKWWYLPIIVVAVTSYLLSLAGIAQMYAYFTEFESCSLNKFFITSTLLGGVAVTIIAPLSCIQKAQPTSGILQAAVVSGYCTYQTWSAISGEPYGPGTVILMDTVPMPCFTTMAMLWQHLLYTGIVVLLITIAVICLYLPDKENFKKCLGINNKTDKEKSDNDAESDQVTQKPCWKITYINDEEEKPAYYYPVFHFLMLISVLYLMMHLTNWAYPGEVNSGHFQNTWGSVWVKMITVWICFGVYIWTLIAPLVLGKCRDFENDTQ